MSGSSDPEREHALEGYRSKLLESREWEAKLKSLRLDIKGLQHDFDVSEENIKALQSVGQIIGEVLKQLDEERCMWLCSFPALRTLTCCSHRKGVVWPALRSRMSIEG